MESATEISTIDVTAVNNYCTMLETDELSNSDTNDILQTLIETVDDVDISMSNFEGFSSQDSSFDLSSKEEINLNVLLQSIEHFLSTATDNIVKSNEIPSNREKNSSESRIAIQKGRILSIKKGQKYNVSFKKKVLSYAVKHTFRETAIKYNVNPNTLTEWAREYKRLLLLKKEGQRPIVKKTTETSDIKFLKWVRQQREAAKLITRQEICTVGGTFLDLEAPEWFRMWLGRFSEEKAGYKSNKQYIKYPLSFKMEVALFAKSFREKAVANAFNVSSRRVYEWCESLDKNKNVSVSKSNDRKKIEQELLTWLNERITIGSAPKTKEIMEKARVLYAAGGMGHVKCSKGWLEKIKKRLDLKLKFSWDDLLLWILKQLDNNRPVTYSMVGDKAKDIAVQQKRDFKGSKSWTLRFLKQYCHILQNCSAHLEDLPQSLIESTQHCIQSFQSQIQSMPNASLGCMDEIPIKFTFPRDKVQTPHLVRQVGFASAHAVVFLAASSDGHLLKPAVILRGSDSCSSQAMQLQNYLPVWYRRKIDPDEQILQEWALHVWLREFKSPSTLIVDSYTPHTSQALQETFENHNSSLRVIPSGYAAFLQPLAFNLSRRFQEVVQESWEEYSTKEEMLKSNMKINRPSDSLILSWISRAHQALQADSNSIRNSFIITGLITSDV